MDTNWKKCADIIKDMFPNESESNRYKHIADLRYRILLGIQKKDIKRELNKEENLKIEKITGIIAEKLEEIYLDKIIDKKGYFIILKRKLVEVIEKEEDQDQYKGLSKIKEELDKLNKPKRKNKNNAKELEI